MPNIVGTNGGDNIDVTDDNGTLNGNPQGTPIDNVRARGGNDTVSVTDSTISGDVRGNGGSDAITVTGSTVAGVVHAGNGGDTVSVSGSDVGNIRLAGGNDVLDFISTTVAGDVRGGSGTDSLNLPAGTVITDSTFGVINVTAGGSYSLSSGTFTLPSGITVTYTTFENGTGFPCFNRDTRILTDKGLVYVQDIKVGDVVQTSDSGLQTVRWIGSRKFSAGELQANPKLRPIRISAGALGNGYPERDLVVSRQHRMLVQSKIVERMFDRPEILVPAIKLTEFPGIFVDDAVDTVVYFHLLFDKHEIIFAEGAPTESLYVGPEALQVISSQARDEILTIFPEIAALDFLPELARLTPTGRAQKQLVARHLKNDKPLLCAVI